MVFLEERTATKALCQERTTTKKCVRNAAKDQNVIGNDDVDGIVDETPKIKIKMKPPSNKYK